MGRSLVFGLLMGAGLLAAPPSLNGGQPIEMRLSPAVTTAPGLVTVRVNVESAADNRALFVTAESPDFYRSSEIQLDGLKSSRLSVFEFRNLPRGVYYVTGVLVGPKGPRASASGIATVAGSA